MTKNHTTFFGYDKVALKLNGRKIYVLVGASAVGIVQEAPLSVMHQQNPLGFNVRDSRASMVQEIKRFDRKNYVGKFGSNGIFVGHGGRMEIKILNLISSNGNWGQLVGGMDYSKPGAFGLSSSEVDKKKLEQERYKKQRQIEDVRWFADMVERAERGEHFTWSGLITDKVTEKTITISGGILVEYPMLMGLNDDTFAELTFRISSFDV